MNKHKHLIIGVVSFAVTLIVLFLIFSLINRNQDQSNQATEVDVIDTQSGADEYLELVEQTNRLISVDQHEEALFAVDNFLGQEDDTQLRFSAYIVRGTILFDQGLYDDAIAQYDKAESELGEPTASTQLSKGEVAERAGNNKAAIEYYTRGVGLLSALPTENQVPGDVEYYTQKIERLRNESVEQ